MNYDKKALIVFILGIMVGVLFTFMFVDIIKGTETGCKFGFHDPYAEVDLAIWNNTDAVTNYCVRCKICGQFLTGITTMRIPIK